MSDTTALAQLGKLIARTHGWPAAKSFKAYTPTDRDKAMIADKARGLLEAFPAAPDAGAPLSAAFAVHLERDLDAPVQVVAGTLKLMGEALPASIAGLSLEGAGREGINHVWVMVGPYVADLAIFRMAYSRLAPARLASHVYEMFGPDQGLLFAPWRETRRIGFDYAVRHVLSGDEIDHLVSEAHRTIAAEKYTPQG